MKTQLATASTISRLPTNSVALTFDDGPDPSSTTLILDILDQHNVCATFFVLGKQVNQHPDLAEDIVRAGHELANHGHNHINLARVGSAQITREIITCQQAIYTASETTAVLFRPPYGSLSPAVVSIAHENKLSTVLWSIDTRDWARPGAGAIMSRAIKAGPGDIILFHDLPHSIAGTAGALPGIIKALTARGLSFATVSQGTGS